MTSDLERDDVSDRCGGARVRARSSAQAAAGAERRDNFIDNIKYGRNDFDYMRSRRRAFRYFFVRAFSRGYVPTTSDVPGRCASFYQLTTFSL